MKKKRSRFRPDDLFGEYREWADNRYNPGHWLGANVPPDTRNLWSPKDRRWLGALFVTTSVLVLEPQYTPAIPTIRSGLSR